MCMEDIKIARSQDAEARSVLCGANVVTQILAPNPRRVSFTIGSGEGGGYRFAPNTLTPSGTVGLVTPNNWGPITITIEMVGNMIFQGWSVFSPAVANNITVIDTTLQATKASELR